jgi:hypothetical protein
MRRLSSKKTAKVLRYTLVSVSLVLFAILFSMLYFSTLPQDADFESKLEAFGKGIDILLLWAFALLVAAIVVSIVFPLISLVKDPKKGIKSLIALGIFSFFVLLAYLFSDGTPLNMQSYTSQGNVPETLILADTLIYTAYFMLALAFLSILFSEIWKLFR